MITFLNRRDMLRLGTATASGLISIWGQVVSTRSQDVVRLVLVHGRDQQAQDPAKLKSDWLAAFKSGSGRSLPDTVRVEFPYYGDLIASFAGRAEIPLVVDMHARGGQAQDEFLEFQAEVAEELRQRAGITDKEVNKFYGDSPRPRGPLNLQWVQALLRALDQYGGGISTSALALVTRDVFLYVTRAGVRDEINAVVASVLDERPTVVIGHSLGSVVAYNVLRTDSRALQVPLFVTVGSPLGIRAVRDQLRPLRFPKPVHSWFNAFDTRDVVSLFPLDSENFPLPGIENYGGSKMIPTIVMV
jgi:hypothetical protein